MKKLEDMTDKELEDYIANLEYSEATSEEYDDELWFKLGEAIEEQNMREMDRLC